MNPEQCQASIQGSGYTKLRLLSSRDIRQSGPLPAAHLLKPLGNAVTSAGPGVPPGAAEDASVRVLSVLPALSSAHINRGDGQWQRDSQPRRAQELQNARSQGHILGARPHGDRNKTDFCGTPTQQAGHGSGFHLPHHQNPCQAGLLNQYFRDTPSPPVETPQLTRKWDCGNSPRDTACQVSAAWGVTQKGSMTHSCGFNCALSSLQMKK